MKKTIIILSSILLFFTGCNNPSNSKSIEGIFTLSSERLLQKYPITFNAEESIPGKGNIINYQWEFGDGKESSGSIVSHEYDEPGNYTLCLTVENSEGKSDRSCQKIEILPSLNMISNIRIGVKEPSGLCMGKDNESLWTVSDQNGKIVEISTSGEIIQTLAHRGSDLEGISRNKNDGSLWIAEETLGEISHLDSVGNMLSRRTIAGVRDGGGLEGIAYNSINNHILLIKEKDPGLLLEFDENFNKILQKRITFAQDFSAVDIDEKNSELWILSHQDSKLFRCTMSGEMVDYFIIPLPQIEGVAYDFENNLLYIVDDSEEKLYTFTFWE